MPYSCKFGGQRGFTLIEILLVILLMGFLGVIALQSYFSSSDTFRFLSAQKDLVNIIRQARSYAINNKDVCDGNKIFVTIADNEVSHCDGSRVSFEGYTITTMPDGIVKINYERISGDFSAEQDSGAVVDKSTEKYIIITLEDAKTSMKSNIVIMQLAGLPEVFNQLPNEFGRDDE